MSFTLILALGTVMVVLVLLFSGHYYDTPVWKRVLIAVLGAAAGYAGTKLMAFIEMGDWGGRSFFGAVLFTPLLMIVFAWLLRMKARDMLDMCAPAECAMLVLMKIQCIVDGCCFGRVLSVAADGTVHRFPSQIVECATAFLLLLLFLRMIAGRKQRGELYAWYLLLYGAIRFILNWFRETSPFIGPLPAGNFWALISMIVGGAVLLYDLSRRPKPITGKQKKKRR